MDKRTLIFFLALSVTLFFVNLWFTQWDQEQNRVWQEQQQAKKIEQFKQLKVDIAKRTVSPSDLPLTELYTDAQGLQKIAIGVQVDQNTLVTAWSESIPQTLYSRKLGSTEKLEEIHLAGNSPKKGEPALYSSGTPKPLRTITLPALGSYDLQLVVTSPTTPQFVTTTLGEYRDSHLILPILKLAKESPKDFESEVPKNNTLVLTKVNQDYLPVGIYDVQHKVLLPLNSLESLAPYISSQQSTLPTGPKGKTEEKFFVLENPYQQLVFSNYGAALAEINLPFLSPENSKSVVREVEYDQEMVEHHPQNARFPAHTYYTQGSSPESSSFELHKEGKLGGYYPLLRRDLIENQANKTIRVKPPFYAFNTVSEYPEVAELVYDVKYFDKQKIVFEAVQPHRRITKTYSLVDEEHGEAPYVLHLTVKVEGDSRGLWLTTGVPEAELMSGSIAPALKFRITRQQKSEVETISLPKDVMTVTSVTPNWISNSNGFFGIILDPLSEIDPGYKAINVPGTVVPSRLLELNEEYQRFDAANLSGYSMLLPLKSSGGTMQFRILAGPYAESVLKTADAAFSNPTTGYNLITLPAKVFMDGFHLSPSPLLNCCSS